MTPEGIVKQQVYKVLYSLEMMGDVIWFERLQSGQFNQGNTHIHHCRKGTFDFVATMRDKKNNLIIAFIEVKRSDKPAFLSDSQKAFKMKYDGKHANIMFWLVTSGDEVKKLILSNCYNRVNDIQFN